MRTLTSFRGTSTLQDQINRLFNDTFEHAGQESNLTAWAPAVDIYETVSYTHLDVYKRQLRVTHK